MIATDVGIEAEASRLRQQHGWDETATSRAFANGG
jgi:hypothetical protein